MFIPVLLWSEIYSGLCTGTQVMNVSPNSFSLGRIPEGYSAPWVASEARKILMVRNINMGHQYRMSSDLPLVHLYPTSVVELGGMSTGPASVRWRLSPTTERFWCKVCLHPHLEHRATPLVERWC